MVGALGVLGGGATIAIVIKAVDKFSGVFKKVNANMLAIGTAVAAVGIAGAIALTKLAGDASNLEESINALNVVFGENAAAIIKVGEDSAKSFGLSKSEFNSGAVRFSAFAKVIAKEGGNVVDVIEKMTGRTADFASVMNIDLNRAQVLIQAGLAGETEGLRRFGIDVSAATVKAFAMANGIGTIGVELTEQQKILGRYGTIMDQTNAFQDDFVNTADDFANSMKILKAKTKTVREELGTSLLPIFADLIGIVQKAVDWFANLSDGTKKFIVIGAAITVALFLLAVPILFLIAILPALAAGWTIFTVSILPVLIPILAIIAAIAAMIAIGVFLFKHWDKLGTKTKILLGILAPFIVLPILIIKNWDKIKVGLALIWNAVIKFTEFAINKVLEKVNVLIDAFNLLAGRFGFGQIANLSISFSGALIDIDKLRKGTEEVVKEEKKVTTELEKQLETVAKLQGFKVLTHRDASGNLVFGDVFDPKKRIRSEFQSSFAFEQARRGAGIEINIENLIGIDAGEISRALSDELSPKASL